MLPNTGRPDLAVTSSPDVVVAPRVDYSRRQTNPWYALAFGAVTCLLIGAGLLVLIWVLSKFWSSHISMQDDQEARRRQEQREEDKRRFDKEQAFFLKKVPEGFSDDAKPRSFFPRKERKLQTRIERTDNALLTIWSRSNPDGWILAAADDYGTRLPTEGEMVEGVLRKIAWEKTYLEKDDFEYERLPDGKEFLGVPAVAIAFAGTNPDKIRVEGEAYVIAVRGYAFMVYTWAPQGNLEANRKLWAEQRAGVAFGDYRASWTPARVPSKVVKLPDSNLEISLSLRVWLEQKLPDEEQLDDGPKQVAEYLGGNPSEDQKTTQKVTAGESAFLKIYKIPKTDSLEAAYTMIETRMKKELVADDDKFEFTYVKDKTTTPIKGPAQIGPGKIPGYLARTESDEGVPRQLVIAVFRQEDGRSVALVFDMVLAAKAQNKNRREFFDTEINVVLNSLVRK